MSKTLIIIAGPTAIGKTALAISLAKHFKTEIISADSRQFYREMNIGTAKPSEAELKEVKHHLINSHSVLDQFNAGDFEKESIELINKLFLNHDQVIMAGGSGLFINAVSHGFDQLPIATEEIRNYFNTILEEKGIKFLQDQLKEIDPVYYKEVDIYNPQRIIRALEVFECSGKTFSSLRTNIKKQRPFNIVKIGLNTDRNIVYERINLRVDQMIKDGLIKEVEGLKSFRHLNPLNTVGYSEIFDYLEGKSNREEAIEKIKQLTWFKKSEDIKWYKPDELEPIIQYLNPLI